jgi:hypothetical protein
MSSSERSVCRNANTTETVFDMNDSIGLYLNDIGKVALLNAEEERELPSG